MSKHTPGPWDFVTLSIDGSAYTVFAVDDNAPSKKICFFENPSDLGEQIANARLIAAAPEMYLLLRTLRNCMKGEASEMIDEVLAKAEGRE